MTDMYNSVLLFVHFNGISCTFQGAIYRIYSLFSAVLCTFYRLCDYFLILCRFWQYFFVQYARYLSFLCSILGILYKLGYSAVFSHLIPLFNYAL